MISHLRCIRSTTVDSNTVGVRGDELRIDERGAAMVEFAFSATSFLLFLIVTFEVGIIGWRTVTAQYIASRVVREAALYAGEEGSGNANFNTVRAFGRRLSEDYGLNIRVSDWNAGFETCPLQYVGHFNSANAGKCIRPAGGYPEGVFGKEEDFLAVRVVIPSRFLLQTIRFDVVGWAVARNEEFAN